MWFWWRLGWFCGSFWVVWGVSMDSTPGKPHPTMVKAAACNILRHYLKSYIDLMYGVHAPMSTLNIIKIHILPYLRFCRSISE